ncbi:MAG: type VI secretion system Vgr family protein [Rhodothermales bacterium]
MLGLNANVARYFFECSELPPEVFQVANFKAVEGISRLYRFEIDLVSHDPLVDFGDVVGLAARFTMMRGLQPVIIPGEVWDFQQLGRTADFVAYRALLVPRLWTLSLTFQSRIFQRMTVQQILEEVLSTSGITHRFELNGQYEEREYCVQFQETSLNFIHRVMEHEGLYYYFDHQTGVETLVITDDHQTLQPISGLSTLASHEGEGLIPGGVERVHDFVCREQGFTNAAMLRDYFYETPNDLLDASSFDEHDDSRAGMGLHYEYGAHYRTTDDGERLSAARREAFKSRHRMLYGGSNCVGFRSGYVFSLEQHYRTDFNEDYLLVEIQHEGSQRHALGLDALPGEGTQPGVTYHNTFQCRPARLPYRPPRRTPVPKVPGLLIATVDHPDRPTEDRSQVDDYAHLDEQGRYKARMDFDLFNYREAEAADFTLPIRMCQPHSGPNYGMHFPNHGGTEMVIACVNGDIDRPMALGTVPNPNHASPSTSANPWQSVIRTWGRNELTFDDKRGEENIYMFATKDHTVRVTNNESISVGNNQSISVGNDRTKSVGHDETNTIQNDRTTTIQDGNDTLTVATGKRDVTVKQDQTFTVQSGNFVVNVQSGSGSMTFQGNRTVDVVTGNDKHTVKGTYELKSEGDMTLESLGKIKITSPTEIELTVGASTIKITPSSIEMASPLIKSEANIVNEIKGPMITSEATGINTIKGGLVTINP